MNRTEFEAKAKSAWAKIVDNWKDDPTENAIIAAAFFAAGWFISSLF